MLTTTNNNESNNYSMYSNMSRDMIKKGDIKDKCTASCFGLVPLHQECYYCPKCDPTHQIRLCLSCFEDCHFDCTYDIDCDNHSMSYYFGIMIKCMISFAFGGIINEFTFIKMGFF